MCVFWAEDLGGVGEVFLCNRPLEISEGGWLCNVFCVAQQCCNNNDESVNNNGLGALTDCFFFMQRALDLLT